MKKPHQHQGHHVSFFMEISDLKFPWEKIAVENELERYAVNRVTTVR